ncbi:hypothetical protein SAY87_003986 [Trapa incisa]|uniref:Uncharacterized protein n=2 Tax=Trapa TaxID=22665 RepID=A0AAN7L9F6_TRANT|nr:hypothetical protein SAY87_003986 [Trapa incisa]KAK4781811.1 hypothetical protein SAY86_015913 [Trapa natans]
MEGLPLARETPVIVLCGARTGPPGARKGFLGVARVPGTPQWSAWLKSRGSPSHTSTACQPDRTPIGGKLRTTPCGWRRLLASWTCPCGLCKSASDLDDDGSLSLLLLLGERKTEL